MERGYVLVHVLEAVVPDADLGDDPVCEITLGDSAVQCPLPSTLQSDNVVLPTCGDPEPVVHVRAFSTQRRDVGLVVVPVTTLVPLEVWNVWYAMDEGMDEIEEKPPEDTPKMHLLLQYVSPEAAAQESAQLREMRAQDFLLRALQQLNASLEAKVLGHQGFQQSPGQSLAATPQQYSSSSISPPAPPWMDPMSSSQGYAAAASSSQCAATPSANFGSGAAPASSQSSLAPSPYRQTSAPQWPAAATPEAGAKLTPKELAQQAKWEDILRARIEPYEKAIASFEERQRFVDEQSAKMADVLKSHEESEERCRTLRAQLDSAHNKHSSEIEAQQELIRQANTSRVALDEQVQQLEQEITLRRAHEDSLQKRVALLESEVSMVHQKCVITESIDQEAKVLQKENETLKEAKRTLSDQVEDKAREIARLTEDSWKQRQEHMHEMNKASARVVEEQNATHQLREDLRRCQDLLRDKTAEYALLGERMEQTALSASTLEGEVASYKAMLDKERAHRKELERRLNEQELKRLDDALDQHRQVIRELRQEVTGVRSELQEEKGKSGRLEEEMAAASAAAAKAAHQELEARSSLGNQEELRQEVNAVTARCEDLRARLQAMQEDNRNMTERYKRELEEHKKSGQALCQERDSQQHELGELRAQSLRSQQQIEELKAEQEHASRGLAAAREAAARADDLQRQLQQAQQECRSHFSNRTELHSELQRITAKFQESAFAQDKRIEELEGTLQERSDEIKLLMYRVQELSSKYTPVRTDHIDMVLAKWVNGYKPAVPFFRLTQGLYLFGRRQVICKISNDKPVFRVGGGFIGFDKFLELYASEELERLLDYETDERTGEPKFAEAQKVQQAMEESGQLDDYRERAELLNGSRGDAGRSQGAPGGDRAQHVRQGSGTGSLADRRRLVN